MPPLPFVDLARQYERYREAIDARMRAVLGHGKFILGPEVAELETKLARHCGAAHAIGVSDGTTALQIALMALGIGRGDEVITTPFTFIATGEALSLLGARPVFVDIDPLTFNLDPGRIEAAITPRSRAILPVSLYGQCADLEAIGAIAQAHGMTVVEDAAQSFGATHPGGRSCSSSLIATTSFFPSKPLGCYGDGGACFSADAALAERIRRIRAHGQAERYRHVEIGLNGRLDTLQAAILLAKLPHLEAELEARRDAARRYDAAIAAAGLERHGVVTPVTAAGHRSAHAQYTIRVPNRDRVAARLATAGIPTAVHYPVPLHRQPVYASEHGHLDLPQAQRAADEVLSLPMHPFLAEADQDRIVTALSDAVRQPG